MRRVFAIHLAMILGAAAIPAAAASRPTSAPARLKNRAFELSGSRWTYHGEGASFDGILVKPEGAGPFPAVLISHGMGGDAAGFSMPKDAKRICTPFCIIHGAIDRTVPPERSAMLRDVLERNDVACERHVFPGVDHAVDQQRPTELLDLIAKWFSQ